jgi:dGTPase
MNDKYKTKTDPKRMIIDFISGMTDDFFNDEFTRIFVPKYQGYNVLNSKD